MKRCLPVQDDTETEATPPSSPVFSRAKRIETENAVNEPHNLTEEETSFDFGFDEESKLSQVNEESELPLSDNGPKQESSTSSSVKFLSLCSLVAASKSSYLSSGCSLLDQNLSGGLRRGEITEVVGESSSGKTQLCLQFCVQAAIR